MWCKVFELVGTWCKQHSASKKIPGEVTEHVRKNLAENQYWYTRQSCKLEMFDISSQGWCFQNTYTDFLTPLIHQAPFHAACLFVARQVTQKFAWCDIPWNWHFSHFCSQNCCKNFILFFTMIAAMVQQIVWTLTCLAYQLITVKPDVVLRAILQHCDAMLVFAHSNLQVHITSCLPCGYLFTG